MGDNKCSSILNVDYETNDAVYEVVPDEKSIQRIPRILPISVKDLREFVLKCHENGNQEFNDQFQVNTDND